MNLDAMDVVARYYDLDLDGFAEDIQLYRDYAQRSGGPILELGCGTGRVARALAADNLAVTAVDISPAMLEIAGQGDHRVEWLQGDVATLDLGKTFRLVLAPLGTLLHIAPRERERAFAAVSRHLHPDGLLILDLPFETGWAPGIQPLVCQWIRLDTRTGSTVSKFVSSEADVTALTQRVTYIFDETDQDGALKRYTSTFDLSYFSENEALLLLEVVGLQAESVYGGYDFGPLEAESERMLIIARRVAG